MNKVVHNLLNISPIVREPYCCSDGIRAHLSRDLRHKSVAMDDDGLLRLPAAVPKVQLDGPAPGQEALAVHFHRGPARQLWACNFQKRRKKKPKRELHMRHARQHEYLHLCKIPRAIRLERYSRTEHFLRVSHR